MFFFALLLDLVADIVESLLVSFALGLLVNLHFLQILQVVLTLFSLLPGSLLELLKRVLLSPKSFLEGSSSRFEFVELLLHRQNFF